MRKNILITGLPHSGKTTMLKNLIRVWADKVGLVTSEVLSGNCRIGFEVETHAGKKSMLSSVDFEGGIYVSRYGVSIKNLEMLIPEVRNFGRYDLLYLDEIGQMQLYSEKFKQLVRQYFDSPNPTLATLSQIYSSDFIEEIKNRKDVIIINIEASNRPEQQEFIGALVGKIFKAQRYIRDLSRFGVESDKARIIANHGVRHLNNCDGQWLCDCDFFRENQICSHQLALEEYLTITY